MTKEVAAIQAGRQRRRDNLKGLSLLWLLILVLALLGAIVAANSKTPAIWMLVWPAPLILIFTAARFVREGYHKRDGVLVLGRRVSSPPIDLSTGPDDDKSQDDAAVSVEGPIAVGDQLSVLDPSGRIEFVKARDLAMSRHSSGGTTRLDTHLADRNRSLAHPDLVRRLARAGNR
jgi:hypothetical protein